MSAEYGPQMKRTRQERSPPCTAPSCWRNGRRRRVDGREAVLCDRHAKSFLQVTT